MAGINYTLDLNNRGFLGGIDEAFSGLRGLGGALARIAGPVAAVAGVASLGMALKKAVDAGAEMETLRTAFIPLLGGAKEAQDRIAELSRFAAETPFEMPEIAAASRTLETLTRGALSTGEGLRLVGDVASASNQPFDQIAVTIGRLYDGLDSGRPVGEALMRLQELGVISGTARGQLEAMQAEGLKGPAVWAVAREAMGRFSGSMEVQSQTWTGKLSTLSDNVTQAFAAFGTPILDAIKPFLDGAISATGTLTEKAAEFGQKVAGVVRWLGAVFQSGELSSIIGNSLVAGFMDATNFLWKSLRASIAAAGELLVQVWKTGISLFEVVTTMDFWAGMGNAIIGLFLSAVATLQRGIADALEKARPLAELFGGGEGLTAMQEDIRASAGMLEGEAADRFDAAGAPLEAAVAKVSDRLVEAGEAIGTRFGEQFAATGDVFDTKPYHTALEESFGRIQGIADEAARRQEQTAAPAAAVAEAMAETAPVAPAAEAAREAGQGTAADRLAQIGGYMGASLQAARDRVAQRTEQWTRRTAEILERMALKPGTEQAQGVF